MLREGRAIRIDDVASAPRFHRGVDRRTGSSTRALLSAPLRGRTGTIGEIPAPAALLARLAMDELLTNVVKYGYVDDGEHTIEIECIAREEEFEVRVVDDGREFDPLNASAYDLESPMEEREVGGLGRHLPREMSDRFTYERRDGHNHMALVKVHRVWLVELQREQGWPQFSLR